jgi:transcriptional regulator with XRE-family HTH domain
MAKRARGLSQAAAAAAIDISTRTAQRIESGEHQPERGHPRRWRTRKDPLADVWESLLVPMLEKAPELEPKTLLLHLEETRPDQDWQGRERTLQRRVEKWKALQGPDKEVIFLQEHKAGVLGISDFTELKEGSITVAGQVLEHRFFHFRLPFSGWCHTEVIHGGESFVALSEGLQNALAACGGVPAEHRSDSLSACYRNRNGNYTSDFTSRYSELCAHLGLIATRNNKGVAHENGPIEGPHAHFKRRLEQQLIKRGSRDFASEEEYRALVARVRDTLNNRPAVQEKLRIERQHLGPLPVYRYPDYEAVVVRVRSTSMIQVREVTYSVPSRLIGQQLTVHLHHDRLHLFLGSHYVITVARLHRAKGHQGPLRQIDFRHVIESLRKKPRALLRAQLQDDLLPGEEWRRIWRDLLLRLPPDQAAKVMVDALHVAARREDLAGVLRYLERHIAKGSISLDGLRRRYGLRPPRGGEDLPRIDIPEHSLQSYDQLLDGTPQPGGAGERPAGAAQTIETGPVPGAVAGGGAGRQVGRLGSGDLSLCAGGTGTPAAPPEPAASAAA